jgi:DNA-directed RNA polymerase subunit RPC12/RpoP
MNLITDQERDRRDNHTRDTDTTIYRCANCATKHSAAWVAYNGSDCDECGSLLEAKA